MTDTQKILDKVLLIMQSKPRRGNSIYISAEKVGDAGDWLYERLSREGIRMSLDMSGGGHWYRFSW